jgi:beta-glucosidase
MKIDKSVFDGRYDLDIWMDPVWNGGLVAYESVMFVGTKDRVRLLYPADEILSVRSFDLKKEFVSGKDYGYDRETGELFMPEGSELTFIPEDLSYRKNEEFPFSMITLRDGVPSETRFSEHICLNQVFVTYTHKPSEDVFAPPDESASFARLLGKLEKGENATLVFYGDSITFGASATDMLGFDPHTPIWPLMFTLKLAKMYKYTVRFVAPGLPSTGGVPAEPAVFGTRGTITYINPAVGGWRAIDGIERYDEYVRPFIGKYGCDFFLLGYGMNDGGNDTATEKGLIKQLADLVYGQSPEAELLLLATMVPNPDSVNGWYANQHLYEPVFYELAAEYTAAGKHCAVGPMTSMSLSVLKRKRFRDYTGNNINHPNDFMSRLYAQVVLATVTGCGCRNGKEYGCLSGGDDGYVPPCFEKYADLSRKDFPENFLWGIATSAAQIEGAALEDGKGLEIWDVFSRTPGRTFCGQTPDLACDYYHKYREQLAMMRELGFNSHRFSFSWARILPDGTGRVNQKGLDFYRRAVDLMLELGLTPNATLYHWDLPQALEERGGFLNRDIVNWYGEYATLLFETFKNEIPLWVTFNEPIATYVGYALGAFAPGRRLEKFGRQANHNLLLAHGEGVRRFRDVFGEKKPFDLSHPNIGLVVDVWHHHPARPGNPDDLRIAELENEKTYRSYMNPVFKGRYTDALLKYMEETGSMPDIRPGDMESIAEPLDFFGLNCYNRVVDSAEPAAVKEAIEFRGGNFMDNGQEFYPKAVYDALHNVCENYLRGIPVVITENGTYNCNESRVPDENGMLRVHDETRIRYLHGFLGWLKKAMAEGFDVRGYNVWTMLDNFEWPAAYSMKFGLVNIEPGATGPRPYVPKDSAYWFKKFLE